MQSYGDRSFRLHVTSETAEPQADVRTACVRALFEPNHSAVIGQRELGHSYLYQQARVVFVQPGKEVHFCNNASHRNSP